MRIAVVNVPLRVPGDPTRWITVPPQGYGGIQWVVSHLVDGLLALGHEVHLLGAPGSHAGHPDLRVVDAAEPAEMRRWLRGNRVDIVHDHSNGRITPRDLPPGAAYCSTHHLTGAPEIGLNCVYVSGAQRAAARAGAAAPVIRLPVNPDRYRFRRDKKDYLLFLGRISAHKGALEAAAFARAAGVPAVLAGPAWEEEYATAIRRNSPGAELVGEVGGAERVELISDAAAVLVLSQPVTGPWGDLWCEPGATVVSEAAVSGTPVIATANGCLPEIVPGVGTLVPYGERFEPGYAESRLAALPSADRVRRRALARWDHVGVARRYTEVYRRIRDGESWS
ncbi:glycosyltransferase family 4 protein [Streptosporangium fragile]|uniref:Glycosyltransferase family 4 protein n=1 Tax=Streptosporangium fragile TaxID=46186 RepID=A0ABP6I6J3_9ACTN